MISELPTQALNARLRLWEAQERANRYQTQCALLISLLQDCMEYIDNTVENGNGEEFPECYMAAEEAIQQINHDTDDERG